MRKSSFTSDLNKEQRLIPFLNHCYDKRLRHYSFYRESNLSEQHKGVDLVFTNLKTKKNYYIDEKAQLDYLNEDLPTFAFEVSYLKNGIRKKGWLFDQKKKTQFYALVTAIFSDSPGEFTSCKITLVNRRLLLGFLTEKCLGFENIRLPQEHGKLSLPTLSAKKEGYLYFSKNNKAEQPLNLVLKLKFLLTAGIAKQLI